MATYTDKELKEALRALLSLWTKCEKAQTGLAEGGPQHSLMCRRTRGLQVAISLVQRELEGRSGTENA